jgi:hypothetical protein
LGVFETMRSVRGKRNGIRPNDVTEMVRGVGVDDTRRVIEQAKRGRGIVVIRTEDDPGPGITRMRPVRVK